MVDKDYKLPKLINNKILMIYQTWFPAQLDSFLTVQMREKENFTNEVSQKNECDTLTK